MKILGICHDVWIASAALVEDGEVINAIAEERLNRQKQSRTFPELAVKWCLENANISLSDVDEVAIAWNPAIDLESVPSPLLNRHRHRAEHFYQVPAHLMKIAGGSTRGAVTQSPVTDKTPPITYVNHYDSHIGNTYFMSGWQDAAVLIIDGRAELQTCFLGQAIGTKVEKLVEVNYPNSLGLFYGTITQFLGYRPDSDEWKVMAMGSEVEPENEFTDKLRQLIRVNHDGSFNLKLEFFEFYNQFDKRMYSDAFIAEFGPPRCRGAEITQNNKKLASAMQLVFEESVAKIINSLHKSTNNKRLAVSGGCFMNSVFNGKISSLTPFEEVFIGSCPDDSGTSVGAALYLNAQRVGVKRSVTPTTNYWGPSFTDEYCLKVAKKCKLSNIEVVDNLSASAVQDLVGGNVIGWFQGHMEFGQRALGNRSILLDPRKVDGKDIVNAAVKFRESFRPFAPAILAEHVDQWFDVPDSELVPFMEKVYKFKSEKMKLVPSVVHSDGTGRLQTVRAEDNPIFYDLISRFFEQTSVPILLNTSFNLNGEPVVCSPEDAIRSFYTCGLDILYLGNVRISKTV